MALRDGCGDLRGLLHGIRAEQGAISGTIQEQTAAGKNEGSRQGSVIKPVVKVTGLPPNTTAHELKDAFRHCGAVEKVTIVERKGFGVLMFATSAGATAALGFDGASMKFGKKKEGTVGVSAGPTRAKRKKAKQQ
eukprot:SAG31_NODE_310_length_17887_cov_4.623060_20_plen_135_part_00